MRAPRHVATVLCPLVFALAAWGVGAAPARAQRSPADAPPAGAERGPIVLVLHSYDPSSEWTVAMGEGIRETLLAAGHSLAVRSEFLDFRFDTRPEYKARLHALLRAKYGNVPLRLIVTTDDAALEFLLDHPDLLGTTPVVFGGVNNDGLAARVPRDQVTGVRERFRVDTVVDTMLHLRPATRRVVLVVDDTLLGESLRQTLAAVMAQRPVVPFDVLSASDLTFEQVIERAAAETTSADLVIANPLIRDHTGRHFRGDTSLARLSQASRAPVIAIGMQEHSTGVLAGTLDTGRQHGAQMGRLAARILGGLSPAALPVEEDDTTLLAFDAQQLARWRIGEQALPLGSVVYNRAPSFYRANKVAIWLGLAFMAAQSLIIGGLVVNVRQRRRAEHRLIEQAAALATQAEALAAANAQLAAANASLREEQATRQQAEERLRHAQKMEAVGRLAGGVAHDFNNLLTIIIGYSALLLDDPPPDPHLADGLAQIRRASEQAATLTQNLLAFSRRQIAAPAVVDVVAAIGGLEPMLRRFCGEPVHLVLDLDPRAGQVELGEGQLEQVLINLVINARDAMPEGGHLRISAHRDAVPGPAPSPDLAVGDYAVITVTDTGHGMDGETRDRVFEPFFTTKEVGRGTGLGLATVYGIVTQHGGAIGVSSEPGRGASFTIWLPVTGRREVTSGESPRVAAVTPLATILVVEDEPELRKLDVLVLKQAGYRVLAAENGDDALRVAAAHDGPLDLLLTDVVMPGMDGFALARLLRETRRGFAVAYMSGYAEPAAPSELPPGETTMLLRKPFLPDELLAHVRQALRTAQASDAPTSG